MNGYVGVHNAVFRLFHDGEELGVAAGIIAMGDANNGGGREIEASDRYLQRRFNASKRVVRRVVSALVSAGVCEMVHAGDRSTPRRLRITDPRSGPEGANHLTDHKADHPSDHPSTNEKAGKPRGSQRVYRDREPPSEPPSEPRTGPKGQTTDDQTTREQARDPQSDDIDWANPPAPDADLVDSLSREQAVRLVTQPFAESDLDTLQPGDRLSKHERKSAHELARQIPPDEIRAVCDWIASSRHEVASAFRDKPLRWLLADFPEAHRTWKRVARPRDDGPGPPPVVAMDDYWTDHPGAPREEVVDWWEREGHRTWTPPGSSHERVAS